jgi:hypothetical protein
LAKIEAHNRFASCRYGLRASIAMGVSVVALAAPDFKLDRADRTVTSNRPPTS